MARFLRKTAQQTVQLDSNLMFGFLKNLLRRSSDDAVMDQTAAAQDAIASQAVYDESETAASPPEPRPGPVHQNGKGLELPLQNVIDNLPLELQPRVAMKRTGKMTITVPLEKILAQLSRGAVKISFGELRQAVPEVFTKENDRDRVLVALPLADILSRLSPAMITRRRVQRQVQVPAEISSPFEGGGEGLAFALSTTRTETPPQAPQPPVRPPSMPPISAKLPPRAAFTPPAAPAAPAPLPMPPAQRLNLKSVSTPPVPAAPPTPGTQHHVAPKPASPRLPASPIAFQAPPAPPKPPAPVPPRLESISMPTARPEQKEAFAQVQPPVFQPKPAQPKLVQKPEPALPMPTPHPVVAPAVPPDPASPPPAPNRPVAAPEQPIMVGLSALADAWPDPVRKDIVDMKLVDAKVALPLSAAEQGLKQGRIAFSWKTIRSWIKPAPASAASAHDGNVLELPLKVIAPLFLARQKDSAKPHQKVAIDEDIPNLFFGFPQAESGIPVAQATARPADTNFYVWDDASDMVKVHEAETKRGPTPGTKFVAKYATPNEVVSRAAGLDGVSGALIALPDGLMVANRLPPDVNADTLAAFLPQIFGKVSQCTKELRMGDLNNLNFTVGNVPWKIFRVNSIFFAAFGRAGEPLPTAQLAALAGELDHNPK